MGNLIFTGQTAPAASESSANDNESPEHLVERPILDTAHESLITVDSANDNSINYGLNKQKSKKKKKHKKKVDASAENVSGQGSEKTRDNTEVNVPFDHHSAYSCPATRVTVETEDQSEIDDEHRSGHPSFEHESPQECTSYTKKKRKKRKKKRKTANVDPVGSTCDEDNLVGDKPDSTSCVAEIPSRMNHGAAAVKIQSPQMRVDKNVIEENNRDLVQGRTSVKKGDRKEEVDVEDAELIFRSEGVFYTTTQLRGPRGRSDRHNKVGCPATSTEDTSVGSIAFPLLMQDNKAPIRVSEATNLEASDSKITDNVMYQKDKAIVICGDDVVKQDGKHEAIDENYLSDPSSVRETRNIMCIFKLIYGVGLRALRKLFMDINPLWSNQPSDAAGYDKGTMKLNKEQEAIFNKGDINEWDFSLMTTALLYSKNCMVEVNKKPGFTLALRELRNCRNSLLGHPSTEKMTDLHFNTFWPILSDNFVKLGAHPNEVAEITHQSDEVLFSGEYYRQLFLKEKAKEAYWKETLGVIVDKLDTVLKNQSTEAVYTGSFGQKELGSPNWDEWIKFCETVGNFEPNQNQYILITDALPCEELECFSILRGVSWRMVLDFDPMSEEKGFYREFTSMEGQSNLVSMITPAELKKSTMSSMLRQIDPQKIQWLFANGRQSDAEGSALSFPEWEATSVKQITRLFSCCSDPDKFDKQKPIVCLILPFRQVTLPYLQVTLSRLVENFDEFRLRLVSFKHNLGHLITKHFEVRHFDLNSKIIRQGLSDMLRASTAQEYRMPSSQAGVLAKLTQNEFLYLNEHLEILNQGCESLPEFSGDPTEAENFFEEHRKSFISGNQISLVSLYDNHDARREISKKIRTHVQRLLDQGLTRSLIVEIRHSPGTGGSTIARRVMWDLHTTYPCAFLKIASSPHYFDEDNTLSDKFADRISALEEICQTSPVILIDGQQSGMIEGLSNKLVRMLCNKGKRALLLRCQHGSKTSKREESSNVHYVFDVNVKLEDSLADLNEFQSKYKEYIAQSLGGNQKPNLCRVFHFPLLSMMEKFRPKLKKIIDDSLDEMGGIQQEIALVVAFLQKYANHATPALLLYEAFKRFILDVSTEKTTTYEDIKQLFTEHLLNLMIPAEPLRPRGRSSGPRETAPEKYTFQHPLVADLVLRKVFRAQECDLFGVVRKFLQYPVYQHESFLPLFEELFLYNKHGRKLKFSILFEDLKRINPELAGTVFCEAAAKTNDATIFANAARFLAKKEPPSFTEARGVMQQAFQANKSTVRLRSLYHTKGVVLYLEMKHKFNSRKVKDLQTVEELASKVLTAYREARNFPPTYPHPLIGEVEVWLACIDWIMKNKCNRDSDKTLKFLTNESPAFFRTCVSDSFHLLDIVDGIVQSVPNLTDPEETQRLSNNARLSLMMTFKKEVFVPGWRRVPEDLIQLCKTLCSAPNFQKSSQVELKRLQAHFFLSSTDPTELTPEKLQYLLKLLEELVLVENEYRLAYHLMKVCMLVTGLRSYTLDQGLTLSERWRDAFPNDCMPYFYQMVIYFLNILDGNSLEFAAKYLKSLRMCREKSQNHFRSTQSTLFVGKDGQGMSRLITRNALFKGETDYSTDDSGKVSRFWRIDSRRKLLECKGRIQVEKSSGRFGKVHPYIELVQGNLHLYVGKNADIGKVERDFPPGSLVYFVVSFNLHGPVANGITFASQNPT